MIIVRGGLVAVSITVVLHPSMTLLNKRVVETTAVDENGNGWL
jgi:hypothetical protein